MTTIERSPEVVNREFTQKFDDLVARVFDGRVVHERVFAWNNGLHASFGYFRGWTLLERIERPVLWGLFKLHDKKKIGKIVASGDGDIDAEGLDAMTKVNEKKVQQYRPSSVSLDDPRYLDHVKRFVDKYRTTFGQKLGIVVNF